MNFWSKLFAGNEKTNKGQSDINQLNKIGTSKKPELLSPLLESLKTLGHHENLLLRKEYDLHSRMPSIDFSIWLIEKLKQKDYESIWAFVKEFYGDDGNSGGGINVGKMVNEIAPTMMVKKYGMNINEAKREWTRIMNLSQSNDEPENQKSCQRQFFDNFLSKDFNAYIEIDEKAIFEIQSFFILKAGMDDSLRGFWISEGSESENITKIISVYSFSVKHSGFKILIVKANNFLKEMKKEEKRDGGGDYWEPISNYNIKDVKHSYSMQPKTDLISKLQSLGIGERLHFFDFASSYSFTKYWSGNSTYKTRSVGVCEAESIKKMVELNLFNYTDDIESIPEIVSKGELKEIAEQNGFELKKSWTLQKIYENLLKSEQGKTFLQKFVQNKKGLKFNDTYKDDLHLIIEYQKQLKIVSDLLSMV